MQSTIEPDTYILDHPVKSDLLSVMTPLEKFLSSFNIIGETDVYNTEKKIYLKREKDGTIEVNYNGQKIFSGIQSEKGKIHLCAEDTNNRINQKVVLLSLDKFFDKNYDADIDIFFSGVSSEYTKSKQFQKLMGQVGMDCFKFKKVNNYDESVFKNTPCIKY